MTLASSSRTSALALGLCVPALALVTSGLLQTATGTEVISPPDWLTHPALVLGGLAGATALAVAAALRLHVERSAEAVTLRLVVRRRPVALAGLALAVSLGAIIFVYLVAENLIGHG